MITIQCPGLPGERRSAWLSDCLAAFILFVVLLSSSAAQAQTFPQLTGRVVDQAHLLTSQQILRSDGQIAGA